MDPYSRPLEKGGGAWMGEFLNRTNNPLLKIGNKARIPIAHINCNFTPPVEVGGVVGKKPVLLTFYEVETLFHEMGHAL